MTEVSVDAAAGSYLIRISGGSLASLGPCIRELFPAVGRVGIISNPVVWGLHGERVLATLNKGGVTTVAALHPDGERYKTMESVIGLLTEFLQRHWERREPLIVVGGGVTGDMGGLSAALLLRGVPLIHVPTTVVAQVDSSIGGKTGVDHPLGKNLIGVFNAPRFILTDPTLLSTLPLNERRAGLGEVLKYAFIGDGALLSLLDRRVEELSHPEFNESLWEEVVSLCASDKARIVSADEKESGMRMVLNFGHTFGHALEGAMGFSGILHGEAVAIGMLSAAKVAVAAGITSPATFMAMRSLIHRAGLPDTWPKEVAYEAILPYLGRDKKLLGGRVSLVLPEEVGRVRIVTEYDPTLLSRGIFA